MASIFGRFASVTLLPVALWVAAPVAAAVAPVGKALFVAVPPIEVPIIDGPRIVGRLRIKLVLQGPDAAAAARLTAHLPILRAAAIAATIDFGEMQAAPYSVVDVAQLKAALETALRAASPDVGHVLVLEASAVPVS